MLDRNADRLRLAAAAALFSTGGAAVKATQFGGWQVAAFRSGIAVLALLLLVPAARRAWSWRVMLVSSSYAACMVLFVLANKNTTAANAIFLQAAAPLYVAIMAPLLLKERVRRADLITMAVMGLGLLLVLSHRTASSSTAPDPALGNVLGMLSGMFWAVTVIGFRWLSADPARAQDTLTTVICGNVVACLVCLPLALPVAAAGAGDLLIMLYLGAVQIALPYYFLSRGIRGVPAVEASMLMMIEPALNPLWAWLVHAEEPGLLPVAGGLIILAATVTRALQSARDEAPGTAAATGARPPADHPR
jgi:drug/metabolite transporter (DMT)-like permease